MERKKTSLFILGLSILLLSAVGVTYAYWNLNLEQTDEDNLATSCFDVVLTEENNAINLEKAYPIVDKDGEELTPYTFKLKNNCKANVKYQINLETLNTVGGESIKEQKLADKYIKEKLNEIEKDGSIRLLTDNEKVTPTLEDASESYKLMTGYMEAEDEKTFELRLWMDENITVNDVDAMEKTFASKITIVATYAKEAKKTLEETILAEGTKAENSGESGLYEVTHEGAEITYTNDPFYQTRLKKAEYRYAGSDPNNYVDFGEKVAEDKFELMMCMQEICGNIQSLGLSLSLEGVFSTEEACETGKTQAESNNMLSSMLEEMSGSLKCEKTATKGDSLYWRIIGLVNTPEGQKVKLIKDTSIGNYSWDTSASEVNNGYGVNEWSQSDLMKLLNPEYENNKGQICILDESRYDVSCNEPDDLVNNSLYWDGKTGKCYTGSSNTTTDCNFTNNSIPENLKKMIETVTWNTGSNDSSYEQETGPGSYTIYYSMDVHEFYNIERSNNTGDICKSGSSSSWCNDGIDRTTSWKGKVGLMYPSDYGYATSGASGGEGDTRSICLDTSVALWYDSFNEENPTLHPGCYENDWLLPSAMDWTISPVATSGYSDGSDFVFGVGSRGFVGRANALYAEGVRPSVYLSSNVIVLSGDGSKNEPYILEAP